MIAYASTRVKSPSNRGIAAASLLAGCFFSEPGGLTAAQIQRQLVCRPCGKDLFVPISCKKRRACPSCDTKRSVVITARALDDLLPRVPYRQWVLTVPKRLRYFVHRDSALAGEVCRADRGSPATDP